MKLQLITNDQIVKQTISISEIEAELKDIRGSILADRGRLTLAQVRKLDSTPVQKLIDLYHDNKATREYAYKISTKCNRFNAILRIIENKYRAKIYSDMLHDRKYQKNKLRLISCPKSELDIIRERLRSFGNSLRAEYSNDDKAESIRNTIRKSRRW